MGVRYLAYQTRCGAGGPALAADRVGGWAVAGRVQPKPMRADLGTAATVKGMQRAGMTTTPEPVPAR